MFLFAHLSKIGVAPSDDDDMPLLDALHRFITGRAADAIFRRDYYDAYLQEIAKQPDGTAKVIEFAEKVYKPRQRDKQIEELDLDAAGQKPAKQQRHIGKKGNQGRRPNYC